MFSFNTPRYQLFQGSFEGMRHANGGDPTDMVVFRIDTLTGKTWIHRRHISVGSDHWYFIEEYVENQ
jgi:hypothetical protein